MLPDWQLPPGVSRGLWEYAHDPAIADRYDKDLQVTPLLLIDLEFALEHFSPRGRAIDLGCGTGRLALALAQCGFQTVALDLSAEMLRVAGMKAQMIGVTFDRLQANLVELGCLADASFDCAGCLFSTLGLIQGADHRQRFLNHVHRLLAPRGVFVLHVHNRWFHLGTRAGRRLLLGNWSGDFVMPPHQGVGAMTMHLFTRREIVRALRRAGFEILDVRPVGTEGPLRWPWLFGGLRAYGFLIAARRK